MHKTSGIVSADGELWKKQRRFLQKFMRREFSAKTLMEDKIREEVPYLWEELGTHEGQPVNPAHLFNDALTNIIGAMIFGSRLG